GRTRHLNKSLEDMLEIILWDPRARVFDRKGYLIAAAGCAKLNMPTGLGVADSVRDQIHEDSTNLTLVGANLLQCWVFLHLERDPLLAGLSLGCLVGRLE